MSAAAVRASEIMQRLPIGPCLAAEVGVWRGDLSSRLLRGHQALRLLMVDRWAPPAPNSSYATSGSAIALKDAGEHEAAYVAAQGVAAVHGDRAVCLRGESVDVAQKVDDRTLDLAFIDGDHSLEGVAADLLAWWPKVRVAGFIGGHDYGHPNQGAVQEAVEGWLDTLAEWEVPATLELGQDRTWFIRKRRAT